MQVPITSVPNRPTPAIRVSCSRFRIPDTEQGWSDLENGGSSCATLVLVGRMGWTALDDGTHAYHDKTGGMAVVRAAKSVSLV